MFPNAQAKTKFEEFTDILNDIIKGRSEPNSFLLLRMKREIEKLKHDNPAYAYSTLGMIAYVECDVENMHRNHKKAIRLSDNFDTNSLYALSLWNFKLYQEAYEIASKSIKLCDDDIYAKMRMLDILIECCYHLDYDDDLVQHLKLWKKLKKEDHPMAFAEDNDDNLTQMLDYFDDIIDNCPDEIVKLDPDLIARSQKLVEGVESYAD